MRELFTLWRNTRMVLLVALCAAVYAAVLIVFKAGIVIIPGITEVRPANLLPMAFSLLLGPAAAWGSALGNLIGDFFGTFGPASFFGFIGNFLLGYVPYKVWGHLGILSSGTEPRMRMPRQWVELGIIGFISATVCAVVTSWGVDLLGLIPFQVLSTIITTNNTISHIVAGFLILLLWERVKMIGLYWKDVMDPRDIAVPKSPRVGYLLPGSPISPSRLRGDLAPHLPLRNCGILEAHRPRSRASTVIIETIFLLGGRGSQSCFFMP